MVRPDIGKWNQRLEDLRRMSIEAKHPRTRKRFLALYQIGSEQTNATQWAKEYGRGHMTVMNWVHVYNQKGPDALHYQRTAGRRPLFAQNKSKKSSHS